MNSQFYNWFMMVLKKNNWFMIKKHLFSIYLCPIFNLFLGWLYSALDGS